jgi:hypothetical protein
MDGELPDHEPIVSYLPQRPGLGRHVWHDPRSRHYAIPEAEGELAAVEHERHSPILDQGQLGSCTGNAGTGLLGTGPFAADAEAAAPFTEGYAVQLYSDATQVDEFPGSYPPMDSGSSGLAVAKVLKARGVIDRYEHAFTARAAIAALQRAPVIVGTVWLSGMTEPDRTGRIHLSGKLEGGHEYLLRGYEPGKTFAGGMLTFSNSWGPGWGDRGEFHMSVRQFSYLLGQQGDVTCPVPRG